MSSALNRPLPQLKGVDIVNEPHEKRKDDSRTHIEQTIQIKDTKTRSWTIV